MSPFFLKVLVPIEINVTVGYPTVGGVIDGDSCMPAVGPCIFEQVMSPFVLIPPTSCS